MPTYYTYQAMVPLHGGATLGYTPGKGFYAKPGAAPAPSTPKPPMAASPGAFFTPSAPKAPVVSSHGPVGVLPSLPKVPAPSGMLPPTPQGWIASDQNSIDPGAVSAFQAGQQGSANSPTLNLDSDPGVLAALGFEQQGLSQLDALLRQQREQQIIQFGDPALAQQAGFGLDPQAGAFAQQNYLSGNATLARLDKSHKDSRTAVINRLASHNILNSGDLGYGENQADLTYGNQVYDARQAALQYLSGLYSQYLQQRQGLQQSVLQARQNAIANFMANPDTYAGAFSGG